MTPKEKAKELVHKYNLVVLDTALGGSNRRVKQCVLIAVDEIIEVARDAYDEEVVASVIIYWNKIKQEIEKL